MQPNIPSFHWLCRICRTRTSTGTANASSASSAADLWWIGRSAARMTCWCASSATATSTLPSAMRAWRPSCQVRTEELSTLELVWWFDHLTVWKGNMEVLLNPDVFSMFTTDVEELLAFIFVWGGLVACESWTCHVFFSRPSLSSHSLTELSPSQQIAISCNWLELICMPVGQRGLLYMLLLT